LVIFLAMAQGIKQMDIRFCLASAAVGSLRIDWPTGTMVTCSDFSDPSARDLTLFSDEVRHTDFREPFSPRVREAIIASGKCIGHLVHPLGIYINSNGPRYETPNEIKLLRNVGDVVGMTAASEAIVMREAGVEYGCLAVVSNLAAGLEDVPLSHEDVVRKMKDSGSIVLNILLEAAKMLAGKS
jgi:5'-methylthioadenosine phosphorylase